MRASEQLCHTTTNCFASQMVLICALTAGITVRPHVYTHSIISAGCDWKRDLVRVLFTVVVPLHTNRCVDLVSIGVSLPHSPTTSFVVCVSLSVSHCVQPVVRTRYSTHGAQQHAPVMLMR